MTSNGTKSIKKKVMLEVIRMQRIEATSKTMSNNIKLESLIMRTLLKKKKPFKINQKKRSLTE